LPPQPPNCGKIAAGDDSIPSHTGSELTGIYMGIFNFFIVIPEILAALVFGKVMETFLTNESAVVQLLGGDNRLTAVVIGGISLAVAAALCTIVTEPAPAPNSSHSQGSVGKPAESSV
jgi:hypothetical protein